MDSPNNSLETIISLPDGGVDAAAEIRYPSRDQKVGLPKGMGKSVSLSHPMPGYSITTGRPDNIQRIRTMNENAFRKRQIPSSVFSKPKSRFGDQPLDTAAVIEAEKNGLKLPFTVGAEPISPISKPLSREHPKTGSFDRRSNSMTTKSQELSGSGTVPADEEALREEEEFLKTMEMIHEKDKKIRLKAVIEWAVFGCISALLIACISVDKLENSSIAGLNLWKWCVLAMVTFCGMLVSRWIMNFSVYIVERNFLLKKKVLYLVHGLKNSVQVFVWFGMVLLAWLLLFNKHLQQSRKNTIFLHRVTATLISLLVGAFLWLIKTLLLKFLAMNFHVNRFFDRIQEAFFYQYVVQILSGPPILDGANSQSRLQISRRLSLRNWKTIKATNHKHAITIEEVYRLKKEKVSTWTMKILIDGISNSGLRTISKALEEVAHYGEKEQNDMEITSEMEAIAAGIRIFRNVADSDDNFIDEESLSRFMIKEEVDLVFQLLDASETRQIDKKTLTEWVVKVYKGRKALAHALNDTKTAVKQLNKLVTVVLVCVTAVIWLLLMEIATSKVLLFLSSQLLLAAFIFGNTCKTIFEAIIFVFIMHPFDVGDRCSVDGKHLIVEEMNILSTVFLKPNNEKVYYPNTILATKAISNFNRSPNMGDMITFAVDFSTPAAKLALLSEKIKSYMEANPQYWYPSHGVSLAGIDDLSRLNVQLIISHTLNFQEFVEMKRRTNLLLFELKRILEEIDIKYSLLPQEIRLKYL